MKLVNDSLQKIPTWAFLRIHMIYELDTENKINNFIISFLRDFLCEKNWADKGMLGLS